MTIQKNQIIGQLVASDYRTASVFKKYQIDFCCQGSRTIEDACEKKNIPAEPVLNDLNKIAGGQNSGQINYQQWPLDLIAVYIEKKHHRYVREKSKELVTYLNKVARVHGERHPELLDIRDEFFASVAELDHHMKKEEQVLFPYIKHLAQCDNGEVEYQTPAFAEIAHPIQQMMNEHSTEGERFRRISALSKGYTPPEDACNTYRVSFALLNEFEEDLHLHIHIENNILFPAALELEKKMNERACAID